MVLITVVVRVVSKSEFKKTLKSDPTVNLVDLYYRAERNLRQEDVKAENVEINIVENEGLSKTESE